MQIKDLKTGIFLILCESEKILEEELLNVDGKILINLEIHNSIRVKEYFKRNRLKVIESSIESKSDLPNEFLTVICHLIVNYTTLFIGTYGLSDSTISIIAEELKNKDVDSRLICLISPYKDLNKKGYKIYNILNINKKEIHDLLI